MKKIINFLPLLFMLSLGLQAQNDGDYFSEDYNQPGTGAPGVSSSEKRITQFYKDHGVISEGVWSTWLSSNFEEVYIIQKGDTLWDISDKFLDSPWYWPKIWEMNSYITNPHWIYPGNELRFTYSGKEGPKITVTRKPIRKKGRDYSVLEKEIPDSEFDELGFHKKSYAETTSRTESDPIVKAGHVCLGERPIFEGEIEGSYIKKDMFHEDEEVQVLMNKTNTCEKGARFALVREVEKNVYKINGVLEIQEKALKEKRCNAKIIEIYGLVSRYTPFIKEPVFNTVPKNTSERLIAEVFSMEPEKKQLGMEEDRICIRFKKKVQAPEAGSMVYFYEMLDPLAEKHELDPYITAVGQIIHSSKDFATVQVIASKKERSITTKTHVTTRF